LEDYAIVVKNISKFFKSSSIKNINSKFKQKGILALDNISFKVKKGQMLAVIGFNGSGKTTLLRTIAGIYKPDLGSIKVNGRIAPILQIGTGFHLELDAKENIMNYGLLLGIQKKELESKIPKIIDFAELDKFSELKLKHYSTGMRARLAFSSALQIDADILLVDEILAVGDRIFREKSFDAFTELIKNGATILYTTHNLDKIYDMAEQVLLINQGEMVMLGKPEEVIKKYRELNKNSN